MRLAAALMLIIFALLSASATSVGIPDADNVEIAVIAMHDL